MAEKYTYTIWMTYGFTVKSDEKLDPEVDGDYYALMGLAKDRLNQIGLQEIISEGDFNDISIEEELDSDE
jgi:hypothetical protein